MPIQVLLVEDNAGDVRLTQEEFRGANPVINLNVVSNGVEAMAFLRHEAGYEHVPRPDIVLLDLNMPKMGGHEVLERIKDDESLKLIPTVVLTTCDSEIDILKSYKLQANCYLTKPVQLKAFNDFWLMHAKLPQQST